MMIIIKKNKVVAIIVIGLLILVAVVLAKNNILANYFDPSEQVITNSEMALIDIDEAIVKATGDNDFFAEYRMERERLRAKQLELLTEIINNKAIEEKTRSAASVRMVEISVDMEKEMKAENLVKAWGFIDCVVFMQPSATTIVVQAKHLSLDEETKLKQMVGKIGNISSETIAIIVRGSK